MQPCQQQPAAACGRAVGKCWWLQTSLSAAGGDGRAAPVWQSSTCRRGPGPDAPGHVWAMHLASRVQFDAENAGRRLLIGLSGSVCMGVVFLAGKLVMLQDMQREHGGMVMVNYILCSPTKLLCPMA